MPAPKQAKKFVIVSVQGGFYYFGEEVPTGEGFLKLRNAAMFSKYENEKGMASVARGDDKSFVVLDFFGPNQVVEFPLTSVLGIHDSIDLSTWKHTTKR